MVNGIDSCNGTMDFAFSVRSTLLFNFSALPRSPPWIEASYTFTLMRNLCTSTLSTIRPFVYCHLLRTRRALHAVYTIILLRTRRVLLTINFVQWKLPSGSPQNTVFSIPVFFLLFSVMFKLLSLHGHFYFFQSPCFS